MAATEHNALQRFVRAAQQHPDRIALVLENRRITFEELHGRISATAAWFGHKGLAKADPVLVFVPVSIELYVHVLALLAIGAVPVFVDEWSNIDRVRQCCETVRPKALLTPARYGWLAFFWKELRRIPLKLSPVRLGKSGQPCALVAVEPQDAALITFTTGSTGTPKAAIRSHAILNAQFSALAPFLEASDRCLTLLPIVVLLNLGLGKTTLLSRISPRTYKPADAWTLLTLVQQEQINTLIASPFLVVELAKRAGATGQPIRSPKTIITGGGPVFPADAALVNQAFPQAKLTIVYGSTEAEPISHISASDLGACPDITKTGLPVGTPEAGTAVAILPMQPEAWPDTDEVLWQRQVLPPNSIGEIVVSGPHVVQHYVNNQPAERETKIRVGETIWHRTGDAGRLDAHGRLFLYGRCSQVTQIGLRTFYPFLLEYEARQFTGVTQAAFLHVNSKPVLAFTMTDAHREKAFVAWAQTRWGTDLVAWPCPAIPLDARHKTKVDYSALEKLITRSSRL